VTYAVNQARNHVDCSRINDCLYTYFVTLYLRGKYIGRTESKDTNMIIVLKIFINKL